MKLPLIKDINAHSYGYALCFSIFARVNKNFLYFYIETSVLSQAYTRRAN